ncbi:MAG: sulfite exporter TauE/SafE family protein [Pseudomonadota bacterium]
MSKPKIMMEPVRPKRPSSPLRVGGRTFLVSEVLFDIWAVVSVTWIALPPVVFISGHVRQNTHRNTQIGTLGAGMIDQISALLAQPLFWALATVAMATGIVRGFAGFGTGMIFIPAAAAIYSPPLAVIAIWIMDGLPALAILLPALRNVAWRTVLPVAAGFAATVSVGVWILLNFDSDTVRWGISLVIFTCVALLVSGWAWRGAKPLWASFAMGSIAGVTGGAASLPVPAVLAWWRAIEQPASTTRANMIVFLFLTEMMAGFAYWQGGVFTSLGVAIGIAVSPPYLLGLLLGQKVFKGADPKIYWRVAICVILASALLGLPLFDGLWR